MTLLQALKTLNILNNLKTRNGKLFIKIAKLLDKEATTHNIYEAKQLLAELEGYNK